MADAKNWWAKPRKVSVCVDTPGWFDRHGDELVKRICASGDDAIIFRNAADVQEGGVAFYLSCMKLTPPEILARNHHNIVVHASALPAGRGFSPLVWQVLEGTNRIPLTMILASDEADAGEILMQEEITFEGNELSTEMRDRIGGKIQDMCVAYLESLSPPNARPQLGTATWYRRRTPDDSRLDPERTIAEQFNLLRVVDNDRYPAFFDYRGRRYVLRIEAARDE